MNTINREALLSLCVDERLSLIEELWDSISGEPEVTRLSSAQRAEVERRLAAYERDPSTGVPWEEARARLRARYG